MIESVWTVTTAPAPITTALKKDIDTDVLVIGAGYTGLCCALQLAEENIETIVIEAETVGFGGSGRNVGLVNAGLWLMPAEVEARLGKQHGEKLNSVLVNSPALVFSLIEKYGIQCDLQKNGTLHLAHSESGENELRKRLEQLQSLGAPVSLLGRNETFLKSGSHRYCAALRDERAGTINPLGYVRGLAHAALSQGVEIFTTTRAQSIQRKKSQWLVSTSSANISARTVVVATNAYTDSLISGLATTISPVHYFQFSTVPLDADVGERILPGKEGAWDTQRVLTSFRLDASRRMIIGSIGNLSVHNGRFLKRWARRNLAKIYPELAHIPFEFSWHGRLAFTPDHLPRIVEPMPGLISVLGFNGRGIGPGSVFGKAIADYICERDPGVLPLPISAMRKIPMCAARGRMIDFGAHVYHTIF